MKKQWREAEFVTLDITETQSAMEWMTFGNPMSGGDVIPTMPEVKQLNPNKGPGNNNGKGKGCKKN